MRRSSGAYELLNSEATDQFRNMARPGYFFIDSRGVIREKFFGAKYRERLSGNNVIAKLFPDLMEEVTNSVEAPHLKLTTSQSDRIAFPGNRITHTAEVHLPPDLHVYAPGAKGYKPINLTVEPLRAGQLRTLYPAHKILYLPAIKDASQCSKARLRSSWICKLPARQNLAISSRRTVKRSR
jgi:hypothetical protein